jgi:hypothetical protein
MKYLRIINPSSVFVSVCLIAALYLLIKGDTPPTSEWALVTNSDIAVFASILSVPPLILFLICNVLFRKSELLSFILQWVFGGLYVIFIAWFFI